MSNNGRIRRIENALNAKRAGPVRLVVVWPGEQVPSDLPAGAVIIRVRYEDDSNE